MEVCITLPHQNKPKVVVSSCLLGENVRYNGKIIKNDFLELLRNYVDFIPVCPEVSIGLPVPRNRIVLVREGNRYKTYQLPNGTDLTGNLADFSTRFLNSLEYVDGFILKAKSPSCGFQGTKTYKTKYGKNYIGRRKGIFALEVVNKFKNFPKSDEIDLQDWYKRYVFLSKLFLFSKYRNSNDKRLFVNRYKDILQLFNKKGFKSFKNNPNRENFLNIFNKNLTEKMIENKIPNFRENLNKNKHFQEKYLIFPERLLKVN